LFIPKKILARKCNISLESLDLLLELNAFKEEILVNTYLVTLYGIEEPNYALNTIPWMQIINLASDDDVSFKGDLRFSFVDSVGNNNDPMSLTINPILREIDFWDGYSNNTAAVFKSDLDFKDGVKTYLRKFNKLLKK
tara:strand:- start:499 stop:912 length:414 start_codon:yes stop_codon:yes gene_type:complete